MGPFTGESSVDVERLLTRAARAGLPFRRLLLLYLDPFALFKDASHGPARARQIALRYNRRMRWMLLPYIRRWLLIAGALFAGIAPAEALAAQTSMVLLPAAFAVGACIGAAVMVCALTSYLLLGRGP
jgi:uncharacterized membrane protein